MKITNSFNMLLLALLIPIACDGQDVYYTCKKFPPDIEKELLAHYETSKPIVVYRDTIFYNSESINGIYTCCTYLHSESPYRIFVIYANKLHCIEAFGYCNPKGVVKEMSKVITKTRPTKSVRRAIYQRLYKYLLMEFGQGYNRYGVPKLIFNNLDEKIAYLHTKSNIALIDSISITLLKCPGTISKKIYSCILKEGLNDEEVIVLLERLSVQL